MIGTYMPCRGISAKIFVNEPIVQGLALADTRMILSGAVPAALLAVLVDFVLGIVERVARPGGL